MRGVFRLFLTLDVTKYMNEKQELTRIDLVKIWTRQADKA